MAQTLHDLYLYLARRDKTGVRILVKMQSREMLPVRIEDISTLNLPTGWEGQINQIIFDARMLWEPWVESADTYEELRASLKVRGYTNIPVNSQPEFTAANVQVPTVNVSYLPRKTTMIRKRTV